MGQQCHSHTAHAARRARDDDLAALRNVMIFQNSSTLNIAVRPVRPDSHRLFGCHSLWQFHQSMLGLQLRLLRTTRPTAFRPCPTGHDDLIARLEIWANADSNRPGEVNAGNYRISCGRRALLPVIANPIFVVQAAKGHVDFCTSPSGSRIEVPGLLVWLIFVVHALDDERLKGFA